MPLLQRRGGVVGEQADVLPGRVHPQLAAGRLDDRRGEAVVVGVGVGADEQPHVLEPEAGLGEGEVELAQPSLAADPGVEEDDAAVGGDRPGVAVRDPRPGQRQPQPPDPGQHPLGARRLGLSIPAHAANPLKSPPRRGVRTVNRRSRCGRRLSSSPDRGRERKAAITPR